MERKIKTLYIITILAILAFLGMQVYWLYGRYKFTITEVQNSAYARIVESITNLNRRHETIVNTDTTERVLNHQASYILKDSVDNDSHMHHLATIISREYNIHELLGIKPGSPLTNEEIEKLDLILSNGDEAIKTKTVTCDVTDAPSKGAVWAALTHADTEFMSPLTIDAVETNLNSIGLYSEVRLTVSDSIEWTPSILKHASVMDPETIFSVPYSEMERKSVIITYHIPIAEIFHDMIGSLIIIAILSVFLIVCLLLQFSTILKLTRLDNIRNSFVTTMIHELKRPISTLKMCVSGIENEHMMKDKETRQDLLRETRNSLDNLSAYFSKLRDITFNNVEQIPLNIQQVSLHNLLDEVTATMTNPADKNVDIINEIDMNLEVSADKTHLMNIINNLIENAVKYSGQDVEIKAEASEDNDGVELKITDTGYGIPASDLKHIFKRFYRGKASTGEQPGMGLGLAYVKLLIDAHGGDISVESTEGKGTCFTIRLPQ